MDTREKLNEYAELRGWNKNKPIGWSEAADFGDWLIKNCFIHNVSGMLCGSFDPDNKTSSATKCKCGREKWEHPKPRN